MNAFEIKWKPKNVRFPKSFQELYPENSLNNLSKDNYTEFLGL
jgi:hypothetical protein